MPPQQDDIKIEQADDGNNNPVVVVNGKEVIVSSATQKPNRSLWVAWLYIFDVRRSWKRLGYRTDTICSGTRATTPLKRRSSCESLTAFYLRSAVSVSTSNGLTRTRLTAPTGPVCERS